MNKKILLLIVAIPFLCILAVLYLYLNQEAMLFQKASLPQNFIFNFEEEYQELFLTTKPNAKINALHFKAKNSKGIVLYFHGRGGNLAGNWGKFSREFTSRGYDLFVIDYRGFGKSTGALSEHSLYYDADFCYDYLTHLYNENQIVIYGRSLGTGIATYVASHHNPKALVLESPYFNIFDLAVRHMPYLPSLLIAMLLKYPLRTDKWIVKVNAAIYIFHGIDDQLVPYDSSVRLLRLLKNKKDAFMISIENGNHNHLRFHPKYQRTLSLILD